MNDSRAVCIWQWCIDHQLNRIAELQLVRLDDYKYSGRLAIVINTWRSSGNRYKLAEA